MMALEEEQGKRFAMFLIITKEQVQGAVTFWDTLKHSDPMVFMVDYA